MWGGLSHCWLHLLLAQAASAAAGQLCLSLVKSLGLGLARTSLCGLVSTLLVASHLPGFSFLCPAPSDPSRWPGERADSKQRQSEVARPF